MRKHDRSTNRCHPPEHNLHWHVLLIVGGCIPIITGFGGEGVGLALFCVIVSRTQWRIARASRLWASGHARLTPVARGEPRVQAPASAE
jgi:UPF0716 family protein affecting phage T7 exclusion